MQRFPEFIDLCRRWPKNFSPAYSTIKQEYEACLLMGFTEEQIIEGAKAWRASLPQDTTNEPIMAPARWLREQAFMFYQPREAATDRYNSLQVVK